MNSDTLKNERARGVIKCALCMKPRVIYSKGPLPSQIDELLNEEDTTYTCGASLLPDDVPFVRQSVVVRRRLNCKSPVEAAYYSSKKLTLPPICCICGSGSGAPLKDDDFIEEIKRQHQTVR